MAPGSLCMPDLLNGGTIVHWKPYFAHCPQIRIWKSGLNTKLHAIVDGLGNPVESMLSAGDDHDSVHAVELLEKVELSGSNVLADRAYGAKTIRAYISEQGASYVIPPQSNVSDPWPVD